MLSKKVRAVLFGAVTQACLCALVLPSVGFAGEKIRGVTLELPPFMKASNDLLLNKIVLQAFKRNGRKLGI